MNRGSKYWQESWEQKVERAELETIGKWFAHEEPVLHKFWLWRARKFSVSKLVIALSDYVFLLWVSLVIAELLRRHTPTCFTAFRSYSAEIFAIFSFIYVLLVFFAKKSPRPNAER
jgi:hypothetical protein